MSSVVYFSEPLLIGKKYASTWIDSHTLGWAGVKYGSEAQWGRQMLARLASLPQARLPHIATHQLPRLPHIACTHIFNPTFLLDYVDCPDNCSSVQISPDQEFQIFHFFLHQDIKCNTRHIRNIAKLYSHLASKLVAGNLDIVACTIEYFRYNSLVLR